TLNRDQNRMEIYSVSPASKVAKSVLVDESKAWITPDTYENLTVCSDGFIVNSSRSGFASLYKYSFSGALLKTVCEEQADVTTCYGQDAAGNIYYQIASPTPLDRTVRRMDAKGKTTTISENDGWNIAQFSSDMSYVVINHSTATSVPVYTLKNSSGNKIRVLEDNAAYASRVADLPVREFFTVQSDGNTLNGYIIKPRGFSESGKYPVIMDQYSGPGSQSVCNRWQLDWQQYFAMQGFVVVCVDGRGTGGRGSAFREAVYRRLGYYETIDQVNAARYVAALPGIDSKRIGICGWSYGGYEALMCATVKGSPYAAACAIAPVTDWRYYDTVYAERYMLTPQQNFEGYEESAPLNRASALACPLMLMYGTSDDNVHPANALQFASALQSAGLLFDMMVFPNMNHSINFCNARAVVYANMLRFFKANL
ncbi:MAG: prolyl oligopeptidase family serine peptidase, partial [Muribaculaceae bacterium]|nr:prolyl oligopeptidase family serine peptidase [Muribaculaceae bacterium]